MNLPDRHAAHRGGALAPETHAAQSAATDALESPLAREARVGLAAMLAIGAGWLGSQAFWAFHTGTMPLLLRQHTSSKLWISIVLSFAGASGTLIPPVAGYLSDRTRTRWGRRAPYIVGGTAVAALCLLALPHLHRFAAIALLAPLLYGSVNLAQAPYLSLLPDVTPPAQRGTASGVMNLCGSLGLIAYFALAAQLWESHPHAVITLVAATLFGGALVPVLSLPRKPVAQEPAPGRGWREHLASLREERALLIYLAATGFCWLGQSMSVSFFTLFEVEELGASQGASQYGPMIFGIVATLASVPVGMAGDRFGRKRVLLGLMVAWVGVAFGLGFSRSLIDALVGAALSAIPFAGLMVIGYALLLDLTPPERTAEIVGLSFIPSAAPQMVGPVIAGAVIDRFGYRAVFPASALALAAAVAVLSRVPARRSAQTGAASGR